MPTRSSRVSPAAPKAPADTSYYRCAVPYHGTVITILWVAFVFMSLAVWLALLVHMVRLDNLEQQIAVQRFQFANLDMKLNALKQAVGNGDVMKPPAAAATTTPAAPEGAAATSAAVSVSPSGKLTRGSLSPDGTKYAGYEEALKAKIGIAVESLDTSRIRHIVIFNPYLESTGAGTALESSMSVRWVDNSTIEYDVLVKRGETEVKDTERVRIFF